MVVKVKNVDLTMLMHSAILFLIYIRLFVCSIMPKLLGIRGSIQFAHICPYVCPSFGF